MPYVGQGQASKRTQLDIGFAITMCDNPSVAAQLCALALAAPLHGFYVTIGTNKAGSSYMFALRHTDPAENVVFYAASYDEFVSEFTETLLIVSEKHKSFAITLQHLFTALKGTLKDLWELSHDGEVSNKPLTK